MDMSRVSSKGQVTIPIEFRKMLGIKEGDKVIFVENGNNVLLFNSNRLAFKEFQAGMEGEAESAGIKDEQDVVDIVKQVREQMWREDNANNA
jgi:AbrB family looped-hinge helix DNA binding protein